jgi:Ca2+-binding EF-hand superfamily protein
MSEGNLSAQQVREFNDMFKMFDVDKDGKISRSDLEATMKSLGMPVKSGDVRDMMAECDLTGSGYIGFSEFLSTLSAKLRNTDRAEVLLEAFGYLDPEGKGYIPAQTLKKELQSWGEPLNDTEFKAMLKEINCSELGLFDYKQFVSSMMNQS